MLDFKVSQKTETKTKINKKFKKTGWLKKTVLGLAVFSVITASSATFLYKTEISPEVAKITKTIDKNKQYLSHIDKSLFSTPYTDADFKEDLAILDKLDSSIVRKAVDNGKYKRGLFETFNEFVYYRTLNPAVSYDEMHTDLLINKGYYPNDTDQIRYAKKEKIKATENKINPSANKRIIATMASYGLFQPTNLAYDNLIETFKQEYGQDAYPQIFMIDGSMLNNHVGKVKYDYQELSDERSKYLYLMEQAYRNKNYKKLKVYFKQSREFYKYIAGLDLGSNRFSTYSKNTLENNNFADAVKLSLIYSVVKNKSNSADEAVMDLYLY